MNAGLVALEQIRRSLGAVTAVLVNRLDAGRDTAAACTRARGASGSAAREMAAVAKVVNEHPDAGSMLSCGFVSAEHLRPLAYLKPAMAAELLPLSRGLTVDEFARLVAAHRVKAESATSKRKRSTPRSPQIRTWRADGPGERRLFVWASSRPHPPAQHHLGRTRRWHLDHWSGHRRLSSPQNSPGVPRQPNPAAGFSFRGIPVGVFPGRL